MSRMPLATFMQVTYFFAIFLAAPLTFGAEDLSPPVVVEFSIEPTMVDVTSTSKGVTITARVTDDLSGVSWRAVGIKFMSPSRQQYVTSSATLIGGDALDGIYQMSVSFPQFAESGTWYLEFLSVTDYVGNYFYYRRGSMSAMGFVETIGVQSVQDLEPPLPIEFSITPASVDISAASQSVNVRTRVVDALSGVRLRGVSVRLISPSGFRTQSQQALLVGGDSFDGTYVVSFGIPMLSEGGTWYVDYLVATDNVGNYRYYRTNDLCSYGFVCSFEVTSVATVDVLPPELLSFTIEPKQVDVSANSASVVVNYRATDFPAGVALRGTGIKISSPDSTQYATAQGRLVSGDFFDGAYVADISIPAYSATGTWIVEFVYLEDVNGNYRFYRAGDLQSLSFDWQLLVGPLKPPVSPQLIADDIANLTLMAFLPPAHARITALSNMLAEVDSLQNAGESALAVDKLFVIRAKTDGCVGGRSANDWITDCDAQIHLTSMIDELITLIEETP